MNTHPIHHGTQQPNFSRVSFLGLLLFMLGSPQRHAPSPEPTSPISHSGVGQYAMIVLLAGILAGVIELSVHLV